MKTPAEFPDLPPALWSRISVADHRLLMLDYDGTLTPFHVQRDQARPTTRMAQLIEGVAADQATTVAIVSGRTLEDLDRFAGALPVVLAGEHGWDQKRRDGSLIRHPLPEAARAALQSAAAAAVQAGWGDRLESKRCSLVLHTRGLPLEEADTMARACSRLWRDSAGGALRLDLIDGGAELRARFHDKAGAVHEILDWLPAGTLPVFLGDDETDEDAFGAVAGSGFGIRVGPEPRPSLASGRLRCIDEVEDFLARWIEVVVPSGDRTHRVS